MSKIARSGARATFARRIWRQRRLECSERARGTEEGEVSLREAERGREEKKEREGEGDETSDFTGGGGESQVDENGATHSTDRHLLAY